MCIRDSHGDDPIHPFAQVPHIGEEQRRVIAIEDASRNRAGIGIVGDIVHPRDPRNPPEDALVGPGEAVEHLQQAQGDREEHALQDADDDGAQHGDDGEEELATPEGPQPFEVGDRHELPGGIEHHRAQRGRRQTCHEGAGEEQHRDNACLLYTSRCV